MTETQFPIEALREAFLGAFADSGRVVLAAPTGSGKSTRVPCWLADAGYEKVLVVEPRRVSCTALAAHLSGGKNGSGNAEFAYRVRFDGNDGAATRVCFVTPGMALNLVTQGRLSEYGAVMLDEFHERSWEYDMLLALLRARGSVPWVITSATLDAEGLAAELDARAVVGQGRTYPVEISYSGGGAPSSDALTVRVVEAVEGAMAAHAGDLLVFLPGKREIAECIRATQQSSAVSNAGVELCEAHAQVARSELQKLWAPSERRRVIFATNIAESSITLPRVRVVIDTGLERSRVHRAGHSVLALVPLAQSSMDQRSGRAGRVAEGYAVRLWSAGYEAKPARDPELLRIDLDELVVRALRCGMKLEDLASPAWLTPPPAFAVEAAVNRLRRAGVLAADRLTKLAEGPGLQVSYQGARILADAPEELLADLCDLVAVLESGRDLSLSRLTGAQREARVVLFDGEHDELRQQLLLLRAGERRRHGLHASVVDEARRLSDGLRKAMGAPSLAESRSLAPCPGEAVARRIATLLPELAFARRPRADRKAPRGRKQLREPWSNGEIELELSPAVQEDPANSPPAKAPKTGLILDQFWLGMGTSARGQGRLLHGCDPRTLADAGVGELKVADAQLERRGDGSIAIRASCRRELAGVVLAVDERELVGEELRSAAVQLILNGKLLAQADNGAPREPGRPRVAKGRRSLAETVAYRLHTWAVLAGFSREHDIELKAEPPECESEWIARSLTRLGVESAEDFELVSASDFEPDWAQILGRPLPDSLAAELGALDLKSVVATLERDFPRLWRHGDWVCRSQVHVARRLVILEALGGPGREPKSQEMARQLPRFRGFAVEYRRASRRLKLR